MLLGWHAFLRKSDFRVMVLIFCAYSLLDACRIAFRFEGFGNFSHLLGGKNMNFGSCEIRGLAILTMLILANPDFGSPARAEDGVLTGFWGAGPAGYRVHWSKDGLNLGEGPADYDGASPVMAVISYKGGILAAFANIGGNPNKHRIHWSRNGFELGEGEIVYQGASRVTAMIAYKGGVLTAFANIGGNPNRHRIHWSEDGKGLGDGPVVYDGSSGVTAMIAYKGGVLTAFANIGGNPNRHRIHWSEDGKGLGDGPIRYEGWSGVKCIAVYSTVGVEFEIPFAKIRSFLPADGEVIELSRNKNKWPNEKGEDKDEWVQISLGKELKARSADRKNEKSLGSGVVADFGGIEVLAGWRARHDLGIETHFDGTFRVKLAVAMSGGKWKVGVKDCKVTWNRFGLMPDVVGPWVEGMIRKEVPARLMALLDEHTKTLVNDNPILSKYRHQLSATFAGDKLVIRIR
jgi:hypothetical protein